ncbi:hypothetical protein QF035_010363 [Streptomyces umbrinus]|uniref:Uncharacterized protein n=1 Tax=Streptomyces umbrinus TaxID=67370 RepID=A0ABU0TAE4_9ACTN|nr:hypothetical protein [Streptomyces umbrinus]
MPTENVAPPKDTLPPENVARVCVANGGTRSDFFSGGRL